MVWKKYASYFLITLAITGTIPHDMYGFEISLPKTGTSFACSMGAASALVAASYILTQHYKKIATQDKATIASWRRCPPSEFWWSLIMASSCIAALFLFTNDLEPQKTPLS